MRWNGQLKKRTKSHMLGNKYQKDKESSIAITVQIEYK